MGCTEFTKYKSLDEIKGWLKRNLNEERYEHTLGTADMAERLAEMLNLDKNKAKLAGLLHDCAKCFPNEKLLEIIHSKIPDVDECELLNYKTLHAPVSAYIAKEEFGVDDAEILSAIRWHTLAYCGMTDFEKIVFLADKIEENTRDLTFSGECLALLKEKNGLDKAMFKCFEATIKSLVDRRLAICHITIDVYNELLGKI
ncbi:TPA: bis(5'-nucleosyl)-tetraphosphatase (symmetrical) YqeK [Candidatus Spyradomonas excrementavium]|nr:bis(5'-nucleosyl)-tetraphosphatase (symmetrical) YqeK [Candidatus Spyradomonas excrementavium]